MRWDGIADQSVEDELVTSDNHFDELFVFQEQDVSGSPDHRINVSFFNVEVDIEAIENLKGNLTQHLVDHLDVAVTSYYVLGGFLADLHPC